MTGWQENMPSNFRGTLACLCAFLLVCCLAAPEARSAIEAAGLSNNPMELAKKAAPSNIMFIIDNSGSMDAEFATDEMWGYFSGNRYPFALGSSDLGLLWRARYSGANRMYYNPNQRYRMWPHFDTPNHNQELITRAQLPYVRNDPRDATATWDLSQPFHTLASPPKGLPDIPRSHYYLWYDANGNGKIDDREVWLVTLKWRGGAVERHYFNFDKGNDGMVTANADMLAAKIGDNELVEVAEANVPAGVKPHWRDDLGLEHTPTPEEELLNFANWYTYHRKRSFAAINAISEALESLQGNAAGVRVGLYTINGVNDGSVNDGSVNDGSGATTEARTGLHPIKARQPGAGGIQDDTPLLRRLLYNLRMPPGPPTPLPEAFQAVARY
ncbi:MAG: hypothetical protein LBH14_01345, partial [Desulfobulbaceae bacterium]|nr:hypothetical protein [Desulfobulbaceae bacterium]